MEQKLVTETDDQQQHPNVDDSSSNSSNKASNNNTFKNKNKIEMSPTAIAGLIQTQLGLLRTVNNTTRYARKVFIGGLPPDIDEDGIVASFQHFGPVFVDWPSKGRNLSPFPPKGYAFITFQEEVSVRLLLGTCLSPIEDATKFYKFLSSPSTKDKLVQIRPWKQSDAEYCPESEVVWLARRKTVFVGGVPRYLKAVDLALILNHLFGSVCYVKIGTDTFNYPRGSARVTFLSEQSFVNIISARFVSLHVVGIDRMIEIVPFVMNNQRCSRNRFRGMCNNGGYAQYFCPSIHCLKYFCGNCWIQAHSWAGLEFHAPFLKNTYNSPRPRPWDFRNGIGWSHATSYVLDAYP